MQAQDLRFRRASEYLGRRMRQVRTGEEQGPEPRKPLSGARGDMAKVHRGSLRRIEGRAFDGGRRPANRRNAEISLYSPDRGLMGPFF